MTNGECLNLSLLRIYRIHLKNKAGEATCHKQPPP